MSGKRRSLPENRRPGNQDLNLLEAANLTFQGTAVLLLMLALILGLFIRSGRSTLWFFLVALALILTGIVSVQDFLLGFANKSIVTIFLLIFITNGLKENFNLIDWLNRKFDSVRTARGFSMRLTAGVSLLSALVNNTPIVALLIPMVQDWSRKKGIPASKLLIPLSYATILGGMITLIGTSTNLVLNGLVTSNGFPSLGFSDFLWPGLLVTAGGWLYFATLGWKLLPSRISALEDFQLHSREYLLEMKVAPGAGIAGKSVKEAGLRSLEGVFLVEVVRGKQHLSPVGPEEVLRENDLLYFAGDTDRIVDLLSGSNGLTPAKTEKFNLEGELQVVEALIPANSGLAGKRVKDTNFRDRFDAAIVAIHRNGQHVTGKIGQQQLEYGDMLLLTAGKNFARLANTDKDLYWINQHRTIREKHKGANLLLGLATLGALSSVFAGLIDLFTALVVILTAMVALGFTGAGSIKKQFNLDLLLILGSAMILGKALIDTGSARWLTEATLMPLVAAGPLWVLVVLFILTVLLTSFVTNVAAVSIIFPVAVALAEETGMDPRPLFLAIAFAASCAFLTPFGYQTNLMVQGPGGYKFSDFFRVGAPLVVIYTGIVLAYLIIFFL